MHATNPTDIRPWYRQFWPWFLIALPGTVVIASLVTVYIAVNNADPVVDGNYYKHGLTINERLEDRPAEPVSPDQADPQRP